MPELHRLDLESHPLKGNFSIAIITPYRAQVNRINSLISSSHLSKDIKEKLKVGTIHSFQGSQADMVIIDLVDSKDKPLGKLYQREQGQRLMNVAITRAKSKLVVVGDIDAIIHGGGSGGKITSSLRRVMNNFKRVKIPISPS